MNDIEKLVLELSGNFTKIIHVNDLKDTSLYWGKNGIGNRFANKKFNYSVIYGSNKVKIYSENENDKIDEKALSNFNEIYTKPPKMAVLWEFIFIPKEVIFKKDLYRRK